VACTYNPPNSQTGEYVDNLSNFISTLGDDAKSLILAGDTNMCALTPEYKPIQAICDNMKFIQVINQTTHKNRLIDQIFVHSSLTVQSAGIAAPIENIHAQTWTKVVIPIHKAKTEYRKVWLYKKANWNKMNFRLMQTNILNEIRNAKSVQHAAQILQATITKTRSECIPQATVKVGLRKG
jgi:exonuclease III